jgi:hypothetical protein
MFADGVDAIDRIEREFPTVRIVAISEGGNFDMSVYQPAAITTAGYLAAAERAGGQCILTKPFESRELIEAVERVIGAGGTCRLTTAKNAAGSDGAFTKRQCFGRWHVAERALHQSEIGPIAGVLLYLFPKVTGFVTVPGDSTFLRVMLAL